MLIIQILNVRTVDGVADYKYLVRVNENPIARGEIKGHRRADGWKVLVERLVKICEVKK